MKMIVCVAENFAVGCGGKLLFSLPPDMKFFRETTAGKVVIMGRATLDSFPGGKPLKNRVNVVLTRNKNFVREGAEVFHSVEDVLSFVQKFNTDDVFVIGGSEIYNLFEPYCNTALVTKVFESPHADRFFFNIDKAPHWILEKQSDVMEYENKKFTFCTYIKH